MCVFVCLIITRERVRRLSPNFQGSSRATKGRFEAQKLGVMGERPNFVLHFWGLGWGLRGPDLAGRSAVQKYAPTVKHQQRHPSQSSAFTYCAQDC